jgi:hypothetical protein
MVQMEVAYEHHISSRMEEPYRETWMRLGKKMQQQAESNGWLGREWRYQRREGDRWVLGRRQNTFCLSIIGRGVSRYDPWL